MPFTLDPEFAAILAAAPPPPRVVTERGDAIALRNFVDPFLDQVMSLLPLTPEVNSKDYEFDGFKARWFTPPGHSAASPGPAVIYAHGGGRIAGTIENYDSSVRLSVKHSGVPFLHVGYRLSPEFPGKTSAEDCFKALEWVIKNANELGVDTTRIAVMGDSGGGGVAASLAILARDRGITLKKQILVFPMLDDRNTVPDPELLPFVSWNYDNNYTGWHASLGDEIGKPSVSPIVAAARLEDFKGLCPAHIDCGELDIFRDESISYASRLYKAGVSCELHIHPGAIHGYGGSATVLSQRAFGDRVRALKSL